MRNFLDLKRLRYFRTIAEQGSLSAAARHLHIAQPALSHHVAELESQIGVSLLVRRHDGVVLTEAGRILAKHATDITRRVERVEAELLRVPVKRSARTELRLAIISSLAGDLTPPLFQALAREMPDLVLRIIESGSRDSRVLLRANEADMAISLTPDRPHEKPVANEQLYLVTASNSASSGGTISLSDALGGPLVMPAMDNPLRAIVEGVAAQRGQSLRVAREINGAVPRLNAVLAGLGGTIVGAHSVLGGADMSGLAARRIVEPELFRPIHIGVRRGFDAKLRARVLPVLTEVLSGAGGMLVGPAR